MEKKCINCSNVDICRVYRDLADIAGGLNIFMRENALKENGYTVLVNALAHDCTLFEAFKGGIK